MDREGEFTRVEIKNSGVAGMGLTNSYTVPLVNKISLHITGMIEK